MRIALILPILFLSVPITVHAQDAPRPTHHPSAQIQRDKQQAEGKKAELEQQAKGIAADMKSTQSSLIDLAARIKKNEQRLSDLEIRMAASRKEQEEIETRLKKDKGSIGTLVLALERLDRTPPEAILAKPGAPLETAQSAMLLQSILPSIYGRAESLKSDLARLDELLTQMQKDKQDVRVTAQDLEKRHAEIVGLLKKRQGLYAQTRTGIQEQEAALREISSRAENLKDLVARIEKREQEARTAALARPRDEPSSSGNARPVAAARPTPIPKAGSAQLPVSGLIRMGYKQLDQIGAESQGLTIEGRPAALVVSPMGGVVRYAGYFKNYGQIIIVEHQKEYHSLIAGLAKIDTVVGQSVAAGEPIGALARASSDGGRPTLYYELRLKGEPVNPARRFSGL